MSDYTHGELLFTIMVENNFAVEIEQNGESRKLISGVSTLNSTLVTKIVLELRYRDYFQWDNYMGFIMGELKLEDHN